MEPAADNGIVDMPSNYSVDETVGRLKSILEARDVTLFAIIDHGGEAQEAGMQMPSTKLVILGSPKSGTPLMLAAPSRRSSSGKTHMEMFGFPITARLT